MRWGNTNFAPVEIKTGSMLHKRIKSFLKVALPALFIYYAASVSLFVHAHVINGVTIVHSHPYTKGSDGKPAHGHSGAQIELIHQLSSFFVPDQIVPSVTIGSFPQLLELVRPLFFCSASNGVVEGISRLRPPPTF
ncbi:MAG: hypothetical protein BGN96_12675 [Bacteroidales bacterium 45-6]|nr:MAG: hypothetical protein BGN96_12675 [Bacteroidales bacterium 45-6]